MHTLTHTYIHTHTHSHTHSHSHTHTHLSYSFLVAEIFMRSDPCKCSHIAAVHNLPGNGVKVTVCGGGGCVCVRVSVCVRSVLVNV